MTDLIDRSAVDNIGPGSRYVYVSQISHYSLPKSLKCLTLQRQWLTSEYRVAIC